MDSSISTERHFVALALLRSLLAHEDVAAVPARADAVLDMISHLQRGDSAGEVVRSFCGVRQQCEPACYLAVFRLRRWLENSVQVRVGAREPQPLRLEYRSHERLVQALRRQAWEWNLEVVSPQDIDISFDWDYSASMASLGYKTAEAVLDAQE